MSKCAHLNAQPAFELELCTMDGGTIASFSCLPQVGLGNRTLGATAIRSVRHLEKYQEANFAYHGLAHPWTVKLCEPHNMVSGIA